METDLSSSPPGNLGENDINRSYVIQVGSRKSQLALIQTQLVIDKLKEFYLNNPDRLEQFKHIHGLSLDFNIVSMTTTGDEITDKPLPAIGTKSLFTRELERALLDRKVDFVVHSLKDLPTTLPEGCSIGAVLKRDNPDDAIIIKKSLRSQINALDLLFGGGTNEEKQKFKVGTSSHRRIAMTKQCNPHLDCIDIRGNLNTRIAKLDRDEGDYDAIILAKAGLDRMGWSDRASSLLRPQTDQRLAKWCYAVGQGALAVECRSDDQNIIDMLSPIIDYKTTYEVVAERSLMKKLEGGCSMPLGVRTTWSKTINNTTILRLTSIVLSLNGESFVEASDTIELSTENKQQRDGSISRFEQQTTGITLSETDKSHVNTIGNMIGCSELGLKVANKLIDLGSLELINREK